MDRNTGWIDTHAHLADEAFSDRLEEVLARAMVARVTRILCVGVDAVASASAVSLANRFGDRWVPIPITHIKSDREIGNRLLH